jgi:hypothetical protein
MMRSYWDEVLFQIPKSVVVERATARVMAETAKLEKAQVCIKDNLAIVGMLLSELNIELDPRSFVKLRETLGSSRAAVAPYVSEGELPGTVVEYNMLPSSVINEKGNKLDEACNKVAEANVKYKQLTLSIEQWDRFKRAAEIQVDLLFELNWHHLNELEY